jgi:hypothetical protein
MRTAICAAHGYAWTRIAIATLALVCCRGELRASPPVPLPQPDGPKHYMIPLEAQNTDWVCAETLPRIPTNFCMSVKAFRIMAIDPKAEP